MFRVFSRPRLAMACLLSVPLTAGIGACSHDTQGAMVVRTTEVASPDVAVTPDGTTLVFSLLGHLFQLPVDGGDAEQLTFGAFFDARPAVSPDGSTIAFQSDRDGSEGNIFLLDLASGGVSQLTDEVWADAPAWAPDGASIVYLHLTRGPGRPAATVRRVWVADGRTETLHDGPNELNSPFVLPDGRPGWALVEWRNSPVAATTHIQVLEADGGVSTRLSVDGVADALVAGREAFYARRYVPLYRASHVADERAVVRLPYDGTPSTRIAPVSVMGIQDVRGEPRFAWSEAREALYIGDSGRLWTIAPSSAVKEPVPFAASVDMDVQPPVPPPEWTPPEADPSRGRLLVTNARALRFDGGAFAAPGSIFIEAGRIAWIGEPEARTVPDDTEVVDAQGRFAIPGLFEMHGHDDWCFDPGYLEHGITSMRNLGAEPAQLQRDTTAAGRPVLNCFLAGQLISGWDFGAHVSPVDAMDARRLVRRMREEGASVIKSHYTLAWPLFRAAVDEARAIGIPAVRHVDTAEDIVKTVTVGAMPTHATGWSDDLLTLLSSARSRVDVTVQTNPRGASARAYRAGVTVLIGTDLPPVPFGNEPPGPLALHDALETLVADGLTPIDVLRMATLTAAETLGAGAHLGSLEPGKMADIVLLDQNPLDDIRATRAIWRVIKGGRLVDRGEPGPPQ